MKAAAEVLQHIDWESMEWEILSPQLHRKYVSTGKMTVARFFLAKGLVVPSHTHPSEQMAFIVEGALKFVFAGREVVVRAGEVLVIPANMPHGAEALEDTIDIDVFSPPRDDWEAKQDSYLR